MAQLRYWKGQVRKQVGGMKPLKPVKKSQPGNVKHKRSICFTDTAFAPGSKANRKQLDVTLRHLPLPTQEGREKCQMHRWATKKERRGRSILHCPDCNVRLCTHCYALYHTTDDIFAMKDRIKEEESALT